MIGLEQIIVAALIELTRIDESISCQNPQVGIEISKILTRELFPIVEFGYRICLGGRLLSKHFDHLFFQFKLIHRSLRNSEFEPTQTIVVHKGCNTIPQISFYYLVVFNK
ncbi:hypothetical protein BpHYR1_046283 [Brachionus plicatilis]|uniref:Uncharacterized protein n=1 Tax=Brachionus plicatilis TaxID=10195 RepID=A0A3M7RXY6_BRAPC|nr:hypothetical protein BpHYR1_046283 [Brachionus plicatilis]